MQIMVSTRDYGRRPTSFQSDLFFLFCCFHYIFSLNCHRRVVGCLEAGAACRELGSVQGPLPVAVRMVGCSVTSVLLSSLGPPKTQLKEAWQEDGSGWRVVLYELGWPLWSMLSSGILVLPVRAGGSYSRSDNTLRGTSRRHSHHLCNDVLDNSNPLARQATSH